MLFGVLFALACTGDAPDETPPGPLDDSWVALLANDPAQFTSLIGADRAGWAALHRSDLTAALASDGPSGARARGELGDLHADLARISAVGWQTTAATWQDRSGLPAGSALALFAGISALENGQPDLAKRWLSQLGDADPSDGLAEALSEALAGGALDGPLPLPAPHDGHLWLRYNEHLAARRGEAALEPLLQEGRQPLQVEATDAGGERAFYDPQLHWTLAAVWSAPSEGEPGLADLIFTGCPTLEDLRAERARLADGGGRGTLCASAGTWSALGLPTEMGPEDDPERARALVRALDSHLDPWSKALADAAPPEGRELLDGLRLAGVLRSRALLAFARRSLLAEHPREALAYAQLAMDLESPRDLSPINAPGLFAALAEANLRTGHTREALDALQVLVEVYPEVVGVDEIVGDLSVLQNLDRRGDSKEN